MNWHQYAKSNGFRVSSNTHYETLCPKCFDDKRRFYIEISTGKSYCHQCKHTQIWNETVKPRQEYPQMEDQQPNRQWDLAKIMQCNAYLNDKYRKTALNYLINIRNLDINIVNYYKLGYSPEDNAITIPEIRGGKVVSVDLRYLEGPLRYRSWGERVIFNQDYAEASQSEGVIVTEGRLDALSAMQLSPEIPVIGLPNNSIIKVDYTKIFSKFKYIYLALDNTQDTEKNIEEIAKKLGKYKCLRVLVPSKDINELLALPNAKELWYQALRAAKPVFTPIICTFKSISKDFSNYYFNEVNESISTGYPELDAITGGFRKGELTILTGYTGVGKSTLAVSLATNMALKGHKAFIGSFELPWHTHIAPMVISSLIKRNIEFEPRLSKPEVVTLLNQLESWDMIRGINRVGSLEIEDLVEAVRIAYKGGYRFVVLDHLHYFIPPGDPSEEKTNIDKALILFQKLVKQELPELHLVLIAHPKQISVDFKSGKVRPLTFMDLKGSSRIAQDADNIWILNNLVTTDDLILEVPKARSLKIKSKIGGKVRVLFDKERFNYTIIPMIP